MRRFTPLLPFLKYKKKDAAVIVQTRNPDEKQEDSSENDSGLEEHAHNLMNAIHAGDAKALVKAFHALSGKSEESGEEEASESPDPHSYDAQNIKAAE